MAPGWPPSAHWVSNTSLPLTPNLVIGGPRQGACPVNGVGQGRRLCKENTAGSLEEHKRRERAQAIGLFRHQLICPAVGEG